MCFRPTSVTTEAKCPKCGTSAAPFAIVCANCGAPLVDAKGPGPAPAMAPGVPKAPGAPNAPKAPAVPKPPTAPTAPGA